MAREYVCDKPRCGAIISYDWRDRAFPFKGAFTEKHTHGDLNNEDLFAEWESGRLDVTFHCFDCLVADEKAKGTYTNQYAIIERYHMLDYSRIDRGNIYKYKHLYRL